MPDRLPPEDEIARLRVENTALRAELEKAWLTENAALLFRRERDDALSRLSALQERAERAEKALEPFGRAAAAYQHSHDEDVFSARPPWAGKDYLPANLSVGHLREARAARKSLTPESQEKAGA